MGCKADSTSAHQDRIVASETAASLLWPPAALLRAERRMSPRGSALTRAGDIGVRVRVVVDGWAFRYRMMHDGRRQILNIMLPGDTFGLETLFGQPPAASVQAASPITYLALSPADLTSTVEQSAELRHQLFNALLAENDALGNWVVRLGKCDAEERTAALLLDLHTRLLQAGLATARGFVLDLTQLELADVVGLHVIHLNRVLGRLRARKLVSIDKKVVTLHDPQRLSELVPPFPHRQLPAALMGADRSFAESRHADG